MNQVCEIRNWCVSEQGGFTKIHKLLPPEEAMKNGRIWGEVWYRPLTDNGSLFRSSRVLCSVDEHTIKTENSQYKLGDPDAEYERRFPEAKTRLITAASLNKAAKKLALNVYRKKPVVVSAVQFTGDNASDIIQWAGDAICRECREHCVSLKISTLEGTMLANVGDWIIKGIKGEFYPCRADIFEASYTQDSLPIPNEIERARRAEEKLAELELAFDRVVHEMDEHGNFKNGVTDESGMIDDGEVMHAKFMEPIAELLKQSRARTREILNEVSSWDQFPE